MTPSSEVGLLILSGSGVSPTGAWHEAVAGASEGDLLRWLDEVQLTRRRPWPGVVGVQAQVGEDGRDGVCLHHYGEQLAG